MQALIISKFVIQKCNKSVQKAALVLTIIKKLFSKDYTLHPAISSFENKSDAVLAIISKASNSYNVKKA